MSNTPLEQNGIDLAEVLAKANALPNAPSGKKQINNNGTHDVTQYAEAEVNVPIPEGYIVPTGSKTITSNGTHDVKAVESAVVDVPIPEGYVIPSGSVNINTNGTHDVGGKKSAIVNVPTGAARTSADLTASGATVNVPAGLYSEAASKSVASGTQGTPTASKSAVSGNSITVTPSCTDTTGYISGTTKTGTGVTVSASELVSGNKAISANGTGIDVTNYKTVSVDVPAPSTQSKSATPSLSAQTISPDSGKLLSSVSVAAITKELLASLDADFVAENIKKDVDLFGLIGALEGGGGGGGISEIFGCSKFVVGSCTQMGSPNFYVPYPSDIFTDINKISILTFTKPSIEWDGPYYTAIAYIKRNAVTIKGYVTNDSDDFSRYSPMRMQLHQNVIDIAMGTTYGITGQPYYYVMWQED